MLKIYLLREISPYPHILTYIVECEKSILIFRRNRYTFDSHNARTFLKHPTPRILPRKHPRSGGASRIYLGTRQKSLRTMFRIYNERHGRKARSRGKGAHEVTHTSRRPPNTRCPKRGLQLDREESGRGTGGGGGGGETHTPSSGGSDRTPGVSGEVFETLVACPRVDGPRRARRWVSTTSWRELAAHQRAPPPGYRVTDSPQARLFLLIACIGLGRLYTASFELRSPLSLSLSVALAETLDSSPSFCSDSGRESSRMKREDVTIPNPICSRPTVSCRHDASLDRQWSLFSGSLRKRSYVTNTYT